MDRFQVWIRPLGQDCRVRVDGAANARWLLERLGQSFVFKTAEPTHQEFPSSCCTFRVAYSSQMSRIHFERLLVAIPQVQLMPEPA